MGGFQMNLKKAKVSEPDSQSKPKISFAFGGTKTTPRPKVPSLQHNGVKKRRINALNDSESESDDEEKMTVIDAFDKKKGGAISGDKVVNAKVNEPLVIKPANGNRDWKEEIRRKRTNEDTYIPNQEHKQEIVIKENNMKYGLTVPQKPAVQPISDPETGTEMAAMSDEQKIRYELISGKKADESKGLIIPIPLEDGLVAQDILSKPDEDDIDQYKDVAVEDFGAALLRGMGWKQNKQPAVKSNTNSILERRKKGVLLGIGAKAVEEDLMADLTGKRGDKLSIPLIKKNKELG